MTVEKNKEIILVVEDEDIARKNLEHILVKTGYEVISVNNGKKAIELLQSTSIDLVITDLKMEQVDGMQVLRKTKELQPYTEVIMITGYATVDSSVEAMHQGAYYYIAKPYKIGEVRKIAREALFKRQLQLENLELKETLKRCKQISSIVGQSSTMIEVQKTINQIAPSDINVLILGESGTGKELVARSIHQRSLRSEKKFIAFNCGSFTEDLMANELFGHEKDAFTGATKAKAGLIKVADGGSIFLDEIGDMPLTMQVKLLRVIQEKEVLPVGGETPVPVDVRFIAATHRDLKEDVEKSHFRQDLFYRLNVITIKLPSLSNRDGDIPLLAYHFLTQKCQAMKKNVQSITRESMELLCQYTWPGNIRELENVIERAVALASGPEIQVGDLPEYIRNLSVETYRRHDSEFPTLEEQEKNYIKWVLDKCDGNKTKSAKMMGIDRVSLWRKIKRFGLEPQSE
ncbi:MAG: sigma-54-dependent Fis family transcriptional regulator [Deltaproteobacteria bacterium]|nr:sigma-54-dependent Fis family transcriptional regulator [Deltaproteobacteria bacterium]MBW1958024.1 sigma-54-dependent Fis family transcriptional regulator [Deltaproteobacteria bacterium]MBW2014174.1 sigma-54-dependent Fis family transcriptional regulator [Deltaproteobacteria bacterium]MBW2088996.1 sigma-54-dependent Fis family transcriptional regulator [Deltaproteobacteria bacterium]